MIKFLDFCKANKHLNLDEAFLFWAVFDEKKYEKSLNDINFYIKQIINNYNPKEYDFSNDYIKALCQYAKKSRLEFSINKNISRFKARGIFHNLIKKNILKIEKNQDLIKIHKRFYQQNKVIFTSNYTRFYFYFLKPNEKLILNDKERAFNKIINNFSEYLSFIYELVACEYAQNKFNIFNVSSIWGKDYECDIYYNNDDFCLLGEVKYKGKKICLKTLNELINKAKLLNLKVDYYLLFSNSGFSNNLLANKNNNVLCKDIFSFKEFL
ncbi:ATP-binding protein [Campylobacter canadensis]|uniref:DUF234 domain-containing protein n=1 Tax=Campylobacter canadensis TaxID=449520 RepID=UPI0015570804|nr:ATP-binding protein [Campylobacter canadensis]MBZ7995732.1 ATP-binding protein [Campylobacter canadensis]MBZ7999608.1 ATP-binding protein [Campylobacter canadensis]MBZ8001305.1 ATP-binding protein [Campylobacter canadensis]MBZ8004298.1 ATP-binding protein [Campylobacter canadensis]